MSLLALSDITIRYSRLTAVRDVSFSMDEGEILFITGPNGAGKSSLLRAIAGVTPVAGGRIDLAGHEITGQAPENIARLPVASTAANWARAPLAVEGTQHTVPRAPSV